MPTVAITLDCEAADYPRCYTRDYIKVAEEFTIPLTWMIQVSGKDPMGNVQLYYREYLHRIPSWHEFGLHLHFEDQNGRYVEDPRERGEMIQMGKDMLKQAHIKPTAFRAGSYALIPPDLKYLEDMGILVDSSAIPNADYKMFVDWDGAPSRPYHPSYEDLRKPGEAKILMVPIATANGKIAYLDQGWEVVRPILEHHLEAGTPVICLGGYDYQDSTEALREAILLLKKHNARFTTLTQIVSEFTL
ncbi:MAG: hypothetical protein ABDI19_08355 [Armatimonadota bacterium]